MTGSGPKGGASSMGLSGSSSCSSEEYSLRWMFQGTGMMGSTGGRLKDG